MKAAFASKTAGAAGAEGCTASMLQTMLRNIEGGVAGNPKPGEELAPAPLKVRLITVEALLLRTWASARAHQTMDWLLGVVGPGVVGALHARSGVDSAGEKDAFRLLCELRGAPFAGLSFDSSKCFDSLDDQALVQVAIDKGFPVAVADALSR